MSWLIYNALTTAARRKTWPAPSNKYVWKFDMPCFLCFKVPLIRWPAWRWQKQSVRTHRALQALHVQVIRLLIWLSGRFIYLFYHMTGVVTGSGVHSQIQYLSPNQTLSRPPKRGCSLLGFLLVGSLTEPYLDRWHRLTLVHGPTYNMMQPRLSMPEIDGPLALTVICVRGWMSKASVCPVSELF